MRPGDLTAYILTEAGAETGWGHLGRCTALAEALAEKGIEPYYLVNGDESFRERIPFIRAVFFDWITDRERLFEQLKGADIVIVDSYLAPEELYRDIAEQVPLCLYIDDNCRLDYPSGIVVNGTVGAETIAYPEHPDIKYLTGGSYVLLRKVFRDVPAKVIKPGIGRILVTFGGGDPLGLTAPVVERLLEVTPNAFITAIGGRLPEVYENHPRVSCRKNLSSDEMLMEMQESDLAVSAAGQTINELARCGVPTLVFQTADNQKDNIAGWQQAGFFSHISDLSTLPGDLKTLESPEEREKRSLIGQQTVDGQGAKRVVGELFKTYYSRKLTIRPAEEKDLMPLFELANDPVVRQNSFNTETIPLCDHRAWFERMLRDEKAKIMVFEIDGELAGQVRFEQKDGEVITSLSVSESFRGLGLSPEMLKQALSGLSVWLTGPVVAFIKPENTASIRAFEKAGYRKAEEGKWELKP